MNAAQRLHNAARYYCIDKRARWSSQYDAFENQADFRIASGPRNATYDTIPRFHVLGAILMDIESIDSDALPEYSELKELLLLAASTAENKFTKEPPPTFEKAAIEDERKRFSDAIRTMTADSVTEFLPLPYRRVLSQGELLSLWGRLKSRWGADGPGSLFYPLSDRTEPSLYAFDKSAFDREFPPTRLRTILHGWGISRIYEVRNEGNKNFLMSTDFWEPSYNGTEGYWCTDALDWIMYASHHETITTGGILTQAVQSHWEEIERKKWESPTSR